MLKTKDRLKQLRNNTGLSQDKFAAKFNIPISVYAQWEMGIPAPPKYVVDMIATILYYVDYARR